MRPTGASRPARTGGFTLVEVLVVTAIIGVLTGLVMLSVGDGGAGRQVEREARRLAAVLELASNAAVRNGTELGLRIDRNEYRFLRLQDEKWQPIERARRGLGEHRLPDGVRLRTRVEGLEAELGESDETVSPQILILSSGEMTPFEVDVQSTHSPRTARISGAITGQVSIEPNVQG